MKKIKIDKEVLDGIKNGNVKQIILKDNIENADEIILKDENEEINVTITAVSTFKNIDDCIKIIPVDLFGYYSLKELKNKYKNFNSINAYRIKYDSNEIEKIDNDELLSIINRDTLKKNNVGHSNNNIYEVLLKDGKEAILKTQKLSSRNNLFDEYQRIKWLENKLNVPKVYYYGEKNNIKYLLMEKIDGLSAHKTSNYANKLGILLRQIHDIDIKDCPFKQNDTDKLLNNALANIDVIYLEVKKEYPEMTKQDIVEFLKSNIPKDRVLVHGDYSLPNIIIDKEGNISVIDLGDVSISTKYFDLFYLKKSMIRNKQSDKLDELLKAYGIDKLDDNYMKWMEIVDKGLF